MSVSQATEEAGGNVLMVGHAATLDTCSRQLVGKEPRPVNELMSIIRKVPYCSVAIMEEVIEEEEVDNDNTNGGRPASPTMSRGGRSSPGGMSSVSQVSRMSTRTTVPAPRTWRIAQPPFPPMTHSSVTTFDWKIMID